MCWKVGRLYFEDYIAYKTISWLESGFEIQGGGAKSFFKNPGKMRSILKTAFKDEFIDIFVGGLQ